MAVDHFYWHPLTLEYCFGPNHPLNPERLRRAIVLFEQVLGITMIESVVGTADDLLRVHASEYISAVQSLSHGVPDASDNFGIGKGDNPPFQGMFEASLAYVGATVAAAKAVCAGAHRAYNMTGGLHHARKCQAAGFCIFNDPAIALSILNDQFERVAYIDIDVHHGEGVQWAFDNDPNVLTCSIHQNGRTLFPGTGFVQDVGSSKAAVNVPLPPETSGDVWLHAFREAILPALDQFQPHALVVQCGTDPHFSDPLARIRCRTQDWHNAVHDLHHLNLPTVVLGGGGYSLTAVPRMWLAAVATFADLPIPERIPEPFASDWDMATVWDVESSICLGVGRDEVEVILNEIRNFILPNIPTQSPSEQS